MTELSLVLFMLFLDDCFQRLSQMKEEITVMDFIHLFYISFLLFDHTLYEKIAMDIQNIGSMNLLLFILLYFTAEFQYLKSDPVSL